MPIDMADIYALIKMNLLSWEDVDQVIQAPKQDDDSDPVTRRLMDSALPRNGGHRCPKCLSTGRFVRMAIVCDTHGPFAGC